MQCEVIVGQQQFVLPAAAAEKQQLIRFQLQQKKKLLKAAGILGV